MSGGPQVFLGATTFCVTCRQISGCREEHLLVPVCLVCPWAAARPLAVRAASFARRVVSKPGQAPPPPTGAAAWPCRRPPAPRPGPAGLAVPSHRWLVVCVLPGQALCGLCGACAEHEEARDCCRQYERADAHVHKGAGCLSDKEPFKQPGEQEETEEAPHTSRCACHQLL